MITLAGSGKTKLVTRAEWSARKPKYTTPFTPSFGTTCHWEGPGMPDFTHSACASYVRGIQNFHMDSRGWADIAYTAVVCPHGYTFEGRWVGNRTGANGTNEGNNTAYAVCYLGGEGDAYTPEAHRAMHDTLTHLRLHGKAGKSVNCHRDWKSTSCPGNVICGHVKAGHYTTNAQPPTPTPAPKPPVPEEDDMVKPLLFRLNAKDPAVLYMSTARQCWHIPDSEALEGYKLDMEMQGLSPDVCVLSNLDNSGTKIDELYDFVVTLPWVGKFPKNWTATGATNPWKGPRVALAT